MFLVLSGLATGASWLCYFRALKLGDAARVAPLDKLSVVLVALFGVLFLGEKLAMPNWIGIALIASGAVLVPTGRESRALSRHRLDRDLVAFDAECDAHVRGAGHHAGIVYLNAMGIDRAGFRIPGK